VEPEVGTRWTHQESGTERTVTDITFLDDQTGRAIVRKWGNDAEPPLLLKTSDGGQTWCRIAVASHKVGTEMGSALFFVDSEVGFIGGEGTRVMKTTDGGYHWPMNKQVYDSYVWFHAMSFLNDQTGWVAGGNGLVFRTNDGGGTWTRQEINFNQPIFSIVFPDPADPALGLLAGNSGALFRTTDGGGTWTRLDSGVDQIIGSVAFADATTGVAVGGEQGMGFILRTTDGGATWEQVVADYDVGLNDRWVGFQDVDFGVDGFGVVVGGKALLVTTDGGATWTQEETGTDAEFFAVSVQGPDAAWVTLDDGLILRRKASSALP